MKIWYKIFLLLFSIQFCFSQDSTKIKFSFSFDCSTFTPPLANLTEGRIGLIKDFNSSKMRLDIGSSPDILNFYPVNKDEKFSIGSDFQAFGFLFSESEKIILQVDAIDALFGGHLSYKKNFEESNISARLRILHLSSHFVDGHYDMENNKWKDDKRPIAFGREFIELHSCYSLKNSRFYIGMNYIFRQRPDVLSKFNYEFSTDYEIKDILSDNINLYISYNFKLSGIQKKYHGNNTIESGLNFGTQRGLRIFLTYYSGKSYFGEYYNDNLSYLGAGFNIFLL